MGASLIVCFFFIELSLPDYIASIHITIREKDRTVLIECTDLFKHL